MKGVVHMRVQPKEDLSRNAFKNIETLSDDKSIRQIYQDFVNKTMVDAEKIKPETLRSKLESVVNMTKEVSRHIENSIDRHFLDVTLNFWRTFGRERDVDVDYVHLPPFEGRKIRGWKRKDKKYLIYCIETIRKTLNDLRKERIDRKVTMDDLYIRISELSFLLNPLLKQFEGADIIRISDIKELGIIRIELKEKCPSSNRLFKRFEERNIVKSDIAIEIINYCRTLNY